MHISFSDSPIPPSTPVGIAASVLTAHTAAEANRLASNLDYHDIATIITIVSGSLSIIISCATLFAFLIHVFSKNQK